MEAYHFEEDVYKRQEYYGTAEEDSENSAAATQDYPNETTGV